MLANHDVRDIMMICRWTHENELPWWRGESSSEHCGYLTLLEFARNDFAAFFLSVFTHNTNSQFHHSFFSKFAHVFSPFCVKLSSEPEWRNSIFSRKAAIKLLYQQKKYFYSYQPKITFSIVFTKGRGKWRGEEKFLSFQNTCETRHCSCQRSTLFFLLILFSFSFNLL